jgi:hypothetical protein
MKRATKSKTFWDYKRLSRSQYFITTSILDIYIIDYNRYQHISTYIGGKFYQVGLIRICYILQNCFITLDPRLI